jgi:hypothetical protein
MSTHASFGGTAAANTHDVDVMQSTNGEVDEML